MSPASLYHGVERLNSLDTGAFGGSLAENVCEAYNFLATNWGPGDEIFIFGFSRGAYTARSLAGFICQVGLLTPLLMDSFFEIYDGYRNRGDKRFDETKWANDPLIPGELGTVPIASGAASGVTSSRLEHLRKCAHLHVTIKVVGVWDTVGSLHVTNWFGSAGDDTTYHTTKLSSSKFTPKPVIGHVAYTTSPEIENAFHALAIDETRGNFPPTLWYLDSSCFNADGSPKVNLKQVWFPGYHSDVGGHSKGSIDTNSVDEITFSWMCDQLVGRLQFSATVLSKYILFRLGDTQFDTKNKKIRNLDAVWRKIEWSNGDLDDTNGWLDFWWVPSLVSTAKASYKRVPGETKAYEYVQGKKTQIDYKHFNEEVHPSVSHRVEKRKDQGYNPVPFRKGWVYVPPTETARGHWKKTSGGKEVILNEYTIPNHPAFQAGVEGEHWQGSLERQFAPKEVLASQAPFVP